MVAILEAGMQQQIFREAGMQRQIFRAADTGQQEVHQPGPVPIMYYLNYSNTLLGHASKYENAPFSNRVLDVQQAKRLGHHHVKLGSRSANIKLNQKNRGGLVVTHGCFSNLGSLNRLVL